MKKSKKQTIVLPPSVSNQLREEAERRGATISGLVRVALVKELGKNE